jgi:hypothetical protein
MKRFRLSTLMLLIVIAALCVALAVQDNQARLHEVHCQHRLAELQAELAQLQALLAQSRQSEADARRQSK